MQLVSGLIALTVLVTDVLAQKERFDIASFTAPKGWQRLDSNNIRIYHDYRKVGNDTALAQIILFRSRASNSTPEKNFNDDWNQHLAQITGTSKPIIDIKKTPDGWTSVEGFASVIKGGVMYAFGLTTLSGFGKAMCIIVHVSGDVHIEAVDEFLNSLTLDSKTTTGSSTQPSTGLPSNFDWSNYSFAAPPRWQTFKSTQSLMLSQTPNVQEGCVITILPPIQSSGNLETDARSIFNQMYPGWGYRFTGEKREDVVKGFTRQGLEYCMIEARMSRQRPDGHYYDYEDGSAWVIGTGQQVVVISGRHNRLKACECYQRYENWGRFFNSFTVKGQPPSARANEDPAKRILGDWMALGSTALTEYIFAANGNYQFIGVGGSTVTRSDANYDYIYIKTSSFTGDGSYSINNGQLILKGRGKAPEPMPFRFDKVNHGGTGWKDRLYMRKISAGDGKEYEVCYEKVK